MEWGQLSLDTPGPLKKDVDAALLILEAHQNDEEIVDVMKMMVTDLEQFLIKNQHDDRVSFFEQQYIRLYNAVYQDAEDDEDEEIEEKDAEIDQDDGPYFTQIEGSFPLMDSSHSQQGSSPTRMKKPKELMVDHKRFMGDEGLTGIIPGGLNKIPEQKGDPTVPSSPRGSPKRDRTNSSYYTAGSPERIRRAIDLDGVTFVPTTTRGFYVRTEEDSITMDESGSSTTVPVVVPPASDKYFDVQIILNQEELNALVSRQRIRSREDVKPKNNSLAAKNVHIATPFVDSSRLMKNYFRTDHPEKWVDRHNGGLRPSRK